MKVTAALFLSLVTGAVGQAALAERPESQVSKDGRLEKTVEKVRQNESLYANLDVRMRETYRSGDHTAVVPLDGAEVVEGKDLAIHFVSQDGLFRLEIEGKSRSLTKTSNRNRLRAFDGTTTRLYDQDAVGNVIRGRSPDHNMVRPHLLLMRYSFLRIPLSTLLGGDEAIAAHPFGKPNPRLLHGIRYEGEKEFHGLNCHVVSVASVLKSNGRSRSRREYWLAEERNFIPVRLLNYKHDASRDVPSGEGVVTEFRKIGEGVWFPVRAHFTAYDKLHLKHAGKQRVQWREEYVVEYVSLNPKYDRAYFSDVEFPEGTVVYELEDGKVTDSYRVGAETP